jgi:acetyl/propionyl-CoA carboxylase alpha subunit
MGTLMAEALSITVGDRTARVDRSGGGQVLVDDATLEVAYGPWRGEVALREPASQTVAFVARAGDTIWVFHEGRTYLATVEAEGAANRRSGLGQGALMAPMPATVIGVNVKPGDAVKAGDVLVLLEAMKMELPLRSPGDAVVSAVHCAAGDLVQPNVSLVDLTADLS